MHHTRQQKRIEHLLRDYIKACSQPIRDAAAGHPVLNVQFLYHGARQQELACKKVHLNFTPLPVAVVDHPIKTDRRSLGCARGVDFDHAFAVLVIT